MWKFLAACHLKNNDNGDGDGEDNQEKKQNPCYFYLQQLLIGQDAVPDLEICHLGEVNKHLDMKLLSLSKHG